MKYRANDSSNLNFGAQNESDMVSELGFSNALSLPQIIGIKCECLKANQLLAYRLLLLF
jgi:hypothetical protein